MYLRALQNNTEGANCMLEVCHYKMSKEMKAPAEMVDKTTDISNEIWLSIIFFLHSQQCAS